MNAITSFFSSLFNKRSESWKVRDLKREVYALELQARAAARQDKDDDVEYFNSMLKHKRQKLREALAEQEEDIARREARS